MPSRRASSGGRASARTSRHASARGSRGSTSRAPTRHVVQPPVADRASLAVAVAAAELMQQSTLASAARVLPTMPSTRKPSRQSPRASRFLTTASSSPTLAYPTAPQPRTARTARPVSTGNAAGTCFEAADIGVDARHTPAQKSTAHHSTDGRAVTHARHTRARGGLYRADDKYVDDRVVSPPNKTIAKNNVLTNVTLGYVVADEGRVRRVVASAITMFLPRGLPLCAQELERITAAIDFVEQREPRLRRCVGSWGACALLSRRLKDCKPAARTRRVVGMEVRASAGVDERVGHGGDESGRGGGFGQSEARGGSDR
eukprot:TRINITY_DN2209_c0_g1_i1.p1 TRINITY_DN2209_c0_g1~~TRINITY_DN2209_c0_g1_i1.p1  ORF type:complete len:316 (-),score=5.30 TRINITY_DN2209_c0_g1_i1:106-1053(-)